MTKLKMVGVGAAALMALGPLASGALAKSEVLSLDSGGMPVAAGTAAIEELSVGAEGKLCSETLRHGKVTVNQAKKDVAVFEETEVEHSCEESTSITGALPAVEMGSNDKVSVSGTAKLVLNLPGGCSYSISKLKGTASFPGTASATVTATGKLKREKGVKSSCPTTADVQGEVELFDAATETLFEAAL